MLNIAWLNNSGNPCGGTLQATHSMISALPDCQHTVFLPARSDPKAEDLLKSPVTIERGKQPKGFDLVVCQNSPKAQIPTDGQKVFYYLHSRAGVKDFPHTAVVSQYLAERSGLPPESVLYQPVTLPRPRGPRRTDKLVVGRICTPTAKKWSLEDWLPHMEAIVDLGVEIHLVGCPQTLQDRVRRALGEIVTHEPSPAAKALLHEWHVLLYTSSVPESFGRVVREAQRAGCWPVVSGVGGFIEQIQQAGGNLVDTPDSVREAFTGGTLTGEEVAEMQRKADALGSLQAWRDGFLERLERVL